MLFSMPRIIQRSHNFFSSRTPNPKLLTAKLEGMGTNPRPRIRPLADQLQGMGTNPRPRIRPLADLNGLLPCPHYAIKE